jgi:hypothetical protein
VASQSYEAKPERLTDVARIRERKENPEMRSVLRSNDTVAMASISQPIKSTANEPQSQSLRYEGHDRAASLVQFISIAALFHGCWHPRNRHKRLRYLIEQLARILFFAQ